MSLLPKCPSRFDKKTFWDDAYKTTEKAFEWYAEFDDLFPLLTKYARRSDQILNVGCGNSDLGANLLSAGWDNVVNVDISDTVIAKMKTLYPTGNYQQMDATKMTFSDGSFDVAVDKGTIDALIPNSATLASKEKLDVVYNVLSETMRVLKPAGRLLCVSLAQRHVVETLKNYFEQSAPCMCLVRTHYLPASNAKSSGKNEDFALPVFVFVVMKMKLNSTIPIYELQSRPDCNLDSNIRCKTGDDWSAGILAHQITQFNVRTANSRFPAKKVPSNHFDVFLELANSTQAVLSGFRLFVVDKPLPAAIKFAVFVVPCGREIDDLYSRVDGRNNLANAVQASRLIVCCLVPKVTPSESTIQTSPNNVAVTLGDITRLLNEAVIQLAPPTFIPATDKAPYLTEAMPGNSDTSPNEQKLGSFCVKFQNRTLRVVQVETCAISSCRTSGKFKSKKKGSQQNVDSVIYKRLTEAEANHLSCIGQLCVKHSTEKNTSLWSCQKLPSNSQLVEHLGANGNKSYHSILQVGDDCNMLFYKFRAVSNSPITWRTFYCPEECANDTIKNEFSTETEPSPGFLSNAEALFQSLNAKNGSTISERETDCDGITSVIILLSCSFVRSIGVFVENMAQLLKQDCKIILMRCCREPAADLQNFEAQIRSNVATSKGKGLAISEMDITDTIDGWTGDA